MPQSSSDKAAELKKEQNAGQSGNIEHSHHGAEKQASGKPEHEFGSTGKPITSELRRVLTSALMYPSTAQADLTKPVEEE